MMSIKLHECCMTECFSDYDEPYPNLTDLGDIVVHECCGTEHYDIEEERG